MHDFVPTLSWEYALLLVLLLATRGLDMLSTWVATPNLVLEANPLARLLGWTGSIIVQITFCLGMAKWPLPAVAISTMGVMLAARNFQSAWLMRSIGEENYRYWHVQRLQETQITLFLFCLAGNTMLTAGLGAAVMIFSAPSSVPFGIGFGIIIYAVAVAFYTMLAMWRMRRATLRKAAFLDRSRNEEAALPPAIKVARLASLYSRSSEVAAGK